METRTVEQIDKEIAKLETQAKHVEGTECEVYTRIVGYYRSVRNWNPGKKDEYGHRKLFTPVEEFPAGKRTTEHPVNVKPETQTGRGHKFYTFNEELTAQRVM